MFALSNKLTQIRYLRTCLVGTRTQYIASTFIYSVFPGDANQLKDFPMPSPARPAAVQKQLKSSQQQQAGQAGDKASKADMSQWFSLFADLDPLANPDAIGKTTKEEDKNCYS